MKQTTRNARARVLSLCLLVGAVLSACGQVHAELLPERASIKNDSIQIEVNPVHELIWTVLYLSDYGQMVPMATNLAYAVEVEQAFRPYEQHEAVQAVNRFLSEGMDVSWPSRLSVFLAGRWPPTASC